jgi:hypothetical protein
MPAPGKAARVYVSGYDLSAFFKKASISAEADLPDATTFGSSAKKYAPGIVDATISAEGLFAYDATTLDAADEVLSAALNADPSVWALCLSGDTFGRPADCASAIEGSYEIEADIGDLATVSAEAHSSVGKERAVILHPLGQETANGNGSSYDSGATGMPTTAGGVGYLQVVDVSGASPSLTVKIQHSADAVTWADLITFAAVTQDHKAERKEVAGTVNRYLRAAWTFAAGTNPVFHVAFCRK